jgi:polar amino acid transport system substrate-binding protein
MRTHPRLLALALSLILTACAGTSTLPSPAIKQALAPTGKLRVGVYPGSPTSMLRDPATGEVKGVSVDLGKELAKRLGVTYEQIEYQRVAEVVEALKSGAADFTVTNASPARAKDVDFTQPLVSIELGFLVPAGSPLSKFADIDKPGIRVGVTQGITSQGALPRELKNAVVVPAANLNVAIEMLAQRKIDAFATNKAILFEMSDSLPGSRVLDGRWGIEHLAIAIPKGRDQGMIYLQAFVEDAIATGLVARAVESAGLRGTVKADSR